MIWVPEELRDIVQVTDGNVKFKYDFSILIMESKNNDIYELGEAKAISSIEVGDKVITLHKFIKNKVSLSINIPSRNTLISLKRYKDTSLILLIEGDNDE